MASEASTLNCLRVSYANTGIELKEMTTLSKVKETLSPAANTLTELANSEWSGNESVRERLIAFAENCHDVHESHFDKGKDTLYASHHAQLEKLSGCLNDKATDKSLKEMVILRLPSSKDDFDFKLCGVSRALGILNIYKESRDFVAGVTKAAIRRSFSLYKEDVDDSEASATDYNVVATKFGLEKKPNPNSEPECTQRTRFVLSRISEQYLSLRLAGELVSRLIKNPNDEIALTQLTLLTGNADYKIQLFNDDQKIENSSDKAAQLTKDICTFTKCKKENEPVAVGTCKIKGEQDKCDIVTSDFLHFFVESKCGKQTKVTLSDYPVSASSMHPHIAGSLLRDAALNTESLTDCIDFSFENKLLYLRVSSENPNGVEMRKECINRMSKLLTSESLTGWLTSLTRSDCQKLRVIEEGIGDPALKAKCIIRLNELKGLQTDEKLLLNPEVLIHLPNEVLNTALSDKKKQELLCQQCYRMDDEGQAVPENLALAKRLLELEFDHNCADTTYSHPILIVCKNGNLDMLKVLYECEDTSFERNPWGPNGITGAMLAARNGNVDVLKFIFSKRESQVLYQHSQLKQNVMHFASRCTDTACLEYLLSQPSVNVEELDTFDQNFLGFMHQSRLKPAMLLALNADHWKKHDSYKYYRSLYSGYNLGDIKEVKNKAYSELTFEEAENLSLYDKRQCLIEYIKRDNLGGVRALMSTDMSCNFYVDENSQNTPLTVAVAYGSLKIIKELVLNKVDVKQNNNLPIFMACIKGQHEVAQYLATCYDNEDFKAVSNIVRASDGLSLTNIVATNGHVETMKVLVQKDPELLEQRVTLKARAEKVDGNFALDGDTPLIVACRAGHVEMVKYLRQEGGPLVQNSKNGQNALHAAVRANKPEVVQALFDVISDADLYTLEGIKDGKSIFDFVRVNRKKSGFFGKLHTSKVDYTEMDVVFGKRRHEELVRFNEADEEIKPPYDGVEDDFEFV